MIVGTDVVEEALTLLDGKSVPCLIERGHERQLGNGCGELHGSLSGLVDGVDLVGAHLYCPSLFRVLSYPDN